MFCLNCGTENPPTANFCRTCGKWQQRESGIPGITCHYCKQNNPQDASFCRNCGTRLDSGISVPSSDPALPLWPVPGQLVGEGGHAPVVPGTPQLGNVPSVPGTPSAPFSPASGQGGTASGGQVPPQGGTASTWHYSTQGGTSSVGQFPAHGVPYPISPPRSQHLARSHQLRHNEQNASPRHVSRLRRGVSHLGRSARGVSRRTVLIALGAVVAAGLGGELIARALSPGSGGSHGNSTGGGGPPTPTSTRKGPTPTPTGSHTGNASCPAGTALCGNTCINIGSNSNNCGACSHVCPAGQMCVSGHCQQQCPSGQVACNGTCINTHTDSNNCGSCGTACRPDQICANGKCQCPSGQTACNGAQLLIFKTAAPVALSALEPRPAAVVAHAEI